MTASSSFGEMFDNLIEQAKQSQSSFADFDPEDAEEVEGKAHDDRITVKMKAGKVTEIDLQPMVMRLDNKTLGEEIAKAVNAAIDANVAAMMNSAQGLDYQTLTKDLREIQGESLRQLDQYTEAMLSMLRGVKDLQ